MLFPLHLRCTPSFKCISLCHQNTHNCHQSPHSRSTTRQRDDSNACLEFVWFTVNSRTIRTMYIYTYSILFATSPPLPSSTLNKNNNSSPSPACLCASRAVSVVAWLAAAAMPAWRCHRSYSRLSAGPHRRCQRDWMSGRQVALAQVLPRQRQSTGAWHRTLAVTLVGNGTAAAHCSRGCGCGHDQGRLPQTQRNCHLRWPSLACWQPDGAHAEDQHCRTQWKAAGYGSLHPRRRTLLPSGAAYSHSSPRPHR